MSASSALVQDQPAWRQGGAGFSRRQVMLAGAVLLVLEAVALLYFVAGTHGWIMPMHRPVSTDFVSFYAAGKLAGGGTPAVVYDHAAHYAAEQAATEPGIAYNYFYYPPVFLLVCAAFARLPYLAAFVAFQIGSLVPCLLVVRRILRLHGWAVLLTLLAFPPVFFTLGTGQNAFLTAALFGAATLLVDRRTMVAGVLLGAVCYKPHFGLLVPVALVAAGRWRTVVAAAGTLGALVGLSAQVFGLDTWRAFIDAAAGARGVYEGSVAFPGMTTPFGAVVALGGSAGLAWRVQAASMAIMTTAVFVTWRRGMSLPVRAAMLLAATPLAVPVAMFYDLMLSGIALAWLFRWSEGGDIPGWLRAGTVAVYAGALLSGNFDPHSHLVVAPVIAVGVFAMVVGAAWREGRVPSPNLTRFAGEGVMRPGRA
jgi:alpha-1,2-mannosyltransferase